MCNHAADSERNCHPVSTSLCSPSIEEVAQKGIYHRESKSPKSHLRFSDTIVAAGETDDNLIRQCPCCPTHNIANKRCKEYQAGGCGGLVVWRRCEDFRDGVERHDTGGASKGEEEAGVSGQVSQILTPI